MRITFDSIAAQAHPEWQTIVVTSRGAVLPSLPQKFRHVEVDLPCPSLPGADRPTEELYDAIRDDKGARVWAGLQTVEPRGHFIVVDYDDLVSRRLASTAAATPDAAGWYISHGYLYDGSPIVFRRAGLDRICGSSAIVHARYFYPAPADDLPLFNRQVHGSHKFIKQKLAALGDPMTPLPYPGAMYRVGHPHAASGSVGVRQHLGLKSFAREPLQGLRRLRNLSFISPSLRREFFAAA
ncbi:hypothetical protein U1701_17080 [Sphingomonas sp. PB2P19]|uniref:hypothetical protein n=1 Tax=Sphingomonas rhamnosi TaxID=3096156 RepID=UPI002FC6B64C